MATSLYKPLDAEAQEFRLLTLKPPSTHDTDLVEATLSTHTTRQHPPFDALSWAWGPVDTSRCVVINGISITVRRKLHEALCSLQHRVNGTGSPLWVDGLCIDQDNVNERNHQVSLMRHIFTSARYVHIWLGTSWPSTSSFLSFLEGLSDAHRAPAALEQLTVEGVRTEIIDNIEKCMNSRWWSRLWVVQEAVLATHAIVHIGRHVIAFETLVAGLVLTFTRLLSLGLDPRAVASRRIYFHLYKFISRERRTHECLFHMHRSSTTVEHDRIYGVLGLLPEELDVVPNYEAPVEDVYEDFTMAVMHRERSLEILTLGGLHWLKGEQLPSWVPNFQIPIQPFPQPGISTSLESLTAEHALLSVGMSGEITRQTRPGELQVRVCILDTVSVSEQLDTSAEDWQHLYVACGAGPEVPQDYVMGMLGKQWWSEYGESLAHEQLGDEPSPGELRHEPERQMQALYGMQPGEHPAKFLALRDVLFANYSMRRFSSMVNSWSGYAFGNAEPGDVIALLAGSAVPFVLRANPGHGRNAYRLVGWADYEASHVRNLEAVRQTASTMTGNAQNLNGVYRWTSLT